MYMITVMQGMIIPGADENAKRMAEQLTINVMAMGDFGRGGVDQAEQIANEFKSKLVARATGSRSGS